MKSRLHKFIANCGYCSRRRAELLIEAGRVAVNGKVIHELGGSVTEKDDVTINGEIIALPKPVTIAFNKPAGLITSTHDTHERLTVMDFLPKSLVDRGILPAGRLDQETEGLLILTNVGDLNHRVTHPRYGTEKEYVATVANRPARDLLDRLERGIVIDGVKTAPANVGRVVQTERGFSVNLIIREGRKRQVRRMFQQIGHDVIHLMRLRIGRFVLGAMKLGEWRQLDDEDIELLCGSDTDSGS